MDQSSDKGAGAGGGASSSTRPYLIRALHDWCTDNGFTPYIAVHVDKFVQVPMEYVSNNEIVLNVGFEATSSLDLGNEFIQFKARFGGTAREIIVPVDHVVAIYARENGQGMAFPPPDTTAANAQGGSSAIGVTAASLAPASEAAQPPASAPAQAKPGLRLAPTPASKGDEEVAKPEQGAATAAPAAAQTPGDGDDEPNGPAPGAGRPALKRVK
ncbi:ClpXP protease specificity-enhancing factor [Paucibacter sp. KBW04]|uniref:ClpXP protease specificity-enhancing factor n=1 Tax=Paucibacter sp. KBW04 TaxID=2153361 RepID=UPI000F5818C6|nr:ClpXP protease specificity-enhancing factor [Paucibacter sp. KBW04]RQO62376.1 ClpXP protease specificity-enhancing factor [Paucibacter sp. KBW04]